ncbi:antichymotrypsin-2-like [Drosophila navojoa]|uniref:antichymotrypsin-2-like n=1 Tax=Drosophila navojoa TaxID=7232 RepID=UPI0011BD69B6|nr:antichymotrypsin-2-like [Drosophila navojoa]
MLRMGAKDDSETSRQLDAGLKFSSSNVNQIADGFRSALQYYQKYSVLRMANRVYVMNSIHLRKGFCDALLQNFFSTPEYIDFKNGQKSAAAINAWVESETNNLIKDLVSPDSFSSDTRLVMINAIYFKGEWDIKFDEQQTQSEDFFIDDKNKIQVSMMNATNDYLYAELPNLDAKALRMSYKDTQLFMLVILPNKKDGLADLENGLKSTTLESIASELFPTKVSVKLPKFKTEFSMELTPVFQALGMDIIFTNPEFDKMLEKIEPLKVSQIVHKAFIEVNEEGTEAAAATAIFVNFEMMSSTEDEPKIFHADHPFCYIIYDEVYGCLFMGNFKQKDPSSINTSELCKPCKSECPRLHAKK